MNSSNIILGPGYLTWNGANFRFGDGGFKAKFIKNFREVTAEEFGRFDSVAYNRMIEVTGRLWSGWENLTTIMPSAAFTPVIGGKLFGTANLNLAVFGQDGSTWTGYNAQLVGIANPELAVQKELWSADVKFLVILRSGYTPDQAGAYYTSQPPASVSYSPPAFTKSNFRAPITTWAWTGITGFTSFNFKNGAKIDWKFELDMSVGDSNPCYVDGFGLVDVQIENFEGTVKGTPIGPTLEQVEANYFQAQALGTLESSNSATLTGTFGANSVILYGAFISEMDGFAWARKSNRIGDITFRTTVPFSAGAPTARAAAS